MGYLDAVGLPFHISDIVNSTLYRFKFPDTFLSDIVDRACHALSIDDQRRSFHPLVWNEARERPGADRIEQVWFAGVHANVGGGYPKQGMSLVALDWMMERAEATGLRFIPLAREAVRHCASVDDKLYDSRAGLGTFYRWKPRDIERICDSNSMRPPRLHATVLERIAHDIDDYAPVNLPHGAVLVTTEPPVGRGLLAHRRAANMERELRAALPAHSLLESLQAPIFVGWLSATQRTTIVATTARWSDGHGSTTMSAVSARSPTISQRSTVAREPPTKIRSIRSWRSVGSAGSVVGVHVHPGRATSSGCAPLNASPRPAASTARVEG
jgi:hypothetical protein